MTADVAVVGGGPVGLGVAIEAALAGLDAVVLDPRGPGTDKACGEGLMPDAVAHLGRWGVHPEGGAIRGLRYTDGRRSAEHRFAGGEGRGVRRTVLHRAMAERADALGVRVVRAAVRGVEQDRGGVTAGPVRARYAVAADGLHSPLRRALGLEARARGSRRYGLRRHFRVEPWSDLVEVHWRADHELYVTGVAPDVVGVALLGRRGLDLGAAIAACPELARRLAGAEPADALRGAGPLRQRSRRRTAGRVALAGDAAGYVDALTGEGLAVGFASARAVVEAVVADDLPSYEAGWLRATRVPRLMTGGMLALAESPLRAAIVPAAGLLPTAFGAAAQAIAGGSGPHPVAA